MYAALAVAPIMIVIPLLQLRLVFKWVRTERCWRVVSFVLQPIRLTASMAKRRPSLHTRDALGFALT